MRCTRCGRSNRPDATYCDACGARFVGTSLPDSLADRVFVGRQAEMGVRQAALEDALAGRGRLVLLAGEPGIGKTRITREFVAHAGQRSALGLWGRCHESAGTAPYWLWVQIIRAYIRERDTVQLRAEMGAGAADIAAIVPEVRERLSDLPLPLRFEDPEQARFRLFDAVTTFLYHAAQHHPLVLVLDDLHWADKPSLLLLEFLVQELRQSRLLVIGTYRDMELSRQHPLSETLAELTREQLLQRLVLHGLNQEEVERFLEVMTDSTPPRTLVESVHTQTEGNPLFLTEIVRLLVQEGAWQPEHWRQRQGVSLRIPAGVQEVIGKRLNRLSPLCNQMLTIAAVIGREFALEELVCLMDGASDERVLEMLGEAGAARVIEEVPQAIGRYQFTHALIQATLYDEMATVRRVRLHRRVGEVLEEVYRTDLEPYLAQLAHHFGVAGQHGDVEKTITYATRAGARASSLLAYEEAVQHYERALQALAHQTSVDGDSAASCSSPWARRSGRQGRIRRPWTLSSTPLLLPTRQGWRKSWRTQPWGSKRPRGGLGSPVTLQPYPGGLTQREVEVLRLIAVGKSNHDIANALFVSPNTVANHVRSILTKTNTTNRTEAAAYARRHALLTE